MTYKLLGVYISDDLSWNVHIEHIVKKANKRLYALRALKKSGLIITQLVQVYCSIVRSILEYACPVWAALPKYLEDAIESVQKRALRIVLPNCHYDDALIQSGITALSQRREEACINFIKRDCLSSPVLKPLIPCVSIDRPYCLRSGERVPVRLVPKTKRFADFCTIKFRSRPVVILCSVIFSLLCTKSAFNYIYMIINLIVFVLRCLLLLSLTFLVIQPLGCERDINKLLLITYDYCTGYLGRVVQECLVTEDITTIDEKDCKDCQKYLSGCRYELYDTPI